MKNNRDKHKRILNALSPVFSVLDKVLGGTSIHDFGIIDEQNEGKSALTTRATLRKNKNNFCLELAFYLDRKLRETESQLVLLFFNNPHEIMHIFDDIVHSANTQVPPSPHELGLLQNMRLKLRKIEIAKYYGKVDNYKGRFNTHYNVELALGIKNIDYVLLVRTQKNRYESYPISTAYAIANLKKEIDKQIELYHSSSFNNSFEKF